MTTKANPNHTNNRKGKRPTQMDRNNLNISTNTDMTDGDTLLLFIHPTPPFQLLDLDKKLRRKNGELKFM